MTLVVWLAATCVIISLVYYLVASIAAMAFALRAASPVAESSRSMPRVAILKPLYGSGAALAENLASFLQLDYPRADFYFAVSDPGDGAVEVAAMLRAKFPSANIKVIVGEEPGCANRKIAKLIKVAEEAGDEAEIFVLSDADVAVERDHLRRVIGELTAREEIGVVTCLYRARPIAGLASRIDALMVNTDFAPQVMLSDRIERTRYALGATIAIKRKVLDDIGGFKVLKDRLADDYFIGKMAADAGYEVRISSSLVTTVSDERNFADFWNHQLRWARTYRTTRPASLATIVIHGPFWSLVLLASSQLNPYAVVGFIAILGSRILMSLLMIQKVLRLPEFRRDIWLVPLKDLIGTAIYFASLLSNKVLWGGRRLRILADGTMQEVNG